MINSRLNSNAIKFSIKVQQCDVIGGIGEFRMWIVSAPASGLGSGKRRANPCEMDALEIRSLPDCANVSWPFYLHSGDIVELNQESHKFNTENVAFRE